MSHEPPAEKQGNDDTGLQIGQQLELIDLENMAFGDPQLSRLIDLFSLADANKRLAILAAVEAISAFASENTEDGSMNRIGTRDSRPI